MDKGWLVSMDALVYTMDGQEYEMLSGILEEESPGLTVSQGVVDREFHLEREYDVVVVGINGALGMGLVCKYRELYVNTGNCMEIRWCSGSRTIPILQGWRYGRIFSTLSCARWKGQGSGSRLKG